MRRSVVVFLLLIVSASQAAIFGIDDRFSILPTHSKNELARATAVGVLSSMIERKEDGAYALQYSQLNTMLCSDQKFYSLPSVDYACSAFLIAPDILVTAGHCSVNVGETKNEQAMYCEAYGWLFDYQVGSNGKVNTDAIPADNYYKCKEIIYAINDKKEGLTYDYAVIRLDRTVTNRTPLKISASPIKIGESVSMIGYPMGAPATYSGNAQVLSLNPVGDSFITNLDAFDGNSGSAVMNAKNEIVGILIGGTPESFLNMAMPQGGSCYRYNKCDMQGKNCTSNEGIVNSLVPVGSEVQSIQPVLKILNAL